MHYRKLYESVHGKIPKNFEVHHILPLHMGGTDTIDNLEALSKEDHAKRHMELYQQYGNFRDMCAYHLILRGELNDEAKFERSSAGGKIGGEIVKLLGIGICTSNTELRSIWASMGGKIGGIVQRDKKLGIHAASYEQNLEWASMGGKASGQFQKLDFQKEMGQRGGPKNKGFRWYVDENHIAQKYTPKEQLIESFEDFITRTKFKKGRK